MTRPIYESDADRANQATVVAALERAAELIVNGGIRCQQDAALIRAHIETLRAGGWRDIASAPDDERFLATVEVRNSKTGQTWWETHVVWLDDETGDIHLEADQGWSLSDYEAWQPLPNPPIAAGAPVGGE